MDLLLQQEKIEYKLEIIKELVKELSEYNNMEGYNNQKKFTISVDYTKDIFDDKYYYNLKIVRGLNNPNNIFNMRFVSGENINNLIKNLIVSLVNLKNFLYTSYTGNKENLEKFNIILKNDVVVEFAIKDDNMLEIVQNIEKEYSKKYIIIKPEDIIEKDKDSVQQEKILRIFNIMTKMFSILEKYNGIENYDNKKAYTLKINNYYNNDRECYVYEFSIIRGKDIAKEVLTLNATIKDNDIVYKLINDLIKEYTNKPNFIYDSITNSTYNDNYSLILQNDMKIEFSFGNLRDRFFYREIYSNNKGQNNLQLKKVL